MDTTTRKPSEPAPGDFPYFRRLWNSIVLSLVGAAFIPLILIGGGMYYYAASALQEKTLQSLRTDVRHHQKTVDRFLVERTGDLRQIANAMDLQSLTRPGAIDDALASLHTDGPAYFTDLGIIDDQGRHLAYAGPYDLIRKNYAATEWFRAVMAGSVYVSDVFSGFRNVPHFIIAVKQRIEGRVLIVRATVDAIFFDNLVRGISAKGGGVSFLVNGQGVFQSRPDGTAPLMSPSHIPVPERFDGIRVSETNGQIRVMGWLETVPWLSVVQMDKKEIFRMLRRMRHVGIFVFILGAILIGFTALLTTNHLVQLLETKRTSIRLMGHHLRQANRMTLSLQLYTGFFQEINETLANIDSTATWIEEQIRNTDNLEIIRKEIDENLTQLGSEILRSRATIQQIIAFSQPADPIVADTDINGMLDDQIELFRRELYFNNIRIVRDYQAPLPAVRTDPSRLKQVFQNLMFNALTAVDKNGKICLNTQSADDRVRIVVSNSGPGIPDGIKGKIFEPLFTTHSKRLGLGLAICRDIVEALGGTITAGNGSVHGTSTSFTIELPIRFRVPDQT